MKPVLLSVILTGFSAGTFLGCTSKKDPAPETISAPDTFGNYFVPEPPSSPAVSIPEVRKNLVPGDGVVLEGKIMGVLNPFVEGRAVFVLGDSATITSCDLVSDDDHCPTPWDACCDPKEILRAGTATIQLVDEKGAVLHRGLKEVNGLKELSQVKIAGILAPQSSADAMIVNASSIYVYPPVSN